MGNQIARDLRFYLVLFIFYSPMKVAGVTFHVHVARGNPIGPQPLMTALFNEVF